MAKCRYFLMTLHNVSQLTNISAESALARPGVWIPVLISSPSQ